MTTELDMLVWAILLGLVQAFATGQFATLQFGMSYNVARETSRSS